jgi:hypothetical protein
LEHPIRKKLIGADLAVSGDGNSSEVLKDCVEWLSGFHGEKRLKNRPLAGSVQMLYETLSLR